MPRFITNEFQCYVSDVTVADDAYYVALQLTVESVRPCTTIHEGSMSTFVGIEGYRCDRPSRENVI